MTYADQADTAANTEFQSRVRAAGVEQALVFVNDSRPEFSILAERIIGGVFAADPLAPLVAGQPGMTATSPDPDLLAAIQYVWPLYGATLVPDTP